MYMINTNISITQNKMRVNGKFYQNPLEINIVIPMNIA